jgi:hypothetical protein
MKIPMFDRNLSNRAIKYKRGADTKVDRTASVPVSIGFETIDTAIIKFLQNGISPITTQDDKQILVPVIYASPERWKSAQKDGNIRDKNGKIMLPIIMIHRTVTRKNNINSPVNKYQTYSFQHGWNRRNVYDRFAIVNGITPSKVYNVVTVPDHYDITYEAIAWTEYMQQMNDVIQAISFESNEYWGEEGNYKFLTRINSFEQVNDLPATGDRMVRSRFSLDVRAYILPESSLNKEGNRGSTSRLEYSPKKVVFDTEIVTKPLIK